MAERQQRVPYGAWIQRARRGSKPSFFLAEEVTSSGMTLRGRKKTSLDGELQLKLLIENEREVLSVQAEVVDWDEQDEGSLTVRFVDLDPWRQDFLTELVDESRFA